MIICFLWICSDGVWVEARLVRMREALRINHWDNMLHTAIFFSPDFTYPVSGYGHSFIEMTFSK